MAGKDYEEIAAVLKIENPGFRKLLRMIASLIRKNLFSKNSVFNYCMLIIFYWIFIRKGLIDKAFWLAYRLLVKFEAP